MRPHLGGLVTLSEDQAPAYPYSVKIERTAKGARYTVHCYNADKEKAMDEAIKMYVNLGKKLESEGQVVAPVEKGGKGE